MAAKKQRLRWLIARPIAHRGFHDLDRGRPENSLPAFEAAVEAGYAIECDVHLTSDGVPIVFHDDDLGRLAARPGCVRDCSAAQLRGMRLLGSDEWIPTLDELLELTDGRVPLVIELKHIPGRDAGLARAVADRLKHYDGPAALMSFDPRLIADVRSAAPQIPRGLTAEGDLWRAREHLATILRLKVDFISYRVRDLPTPAPLFANKALGIPLISWTIRNPQQLSRARAWSDQITFEGFSA